ncbi:hypothetical protein [Paenibacillus contaminans]|nr:hypothetical protein [Paenibacillus contaminans]
MNKALKISARTILVVVLSLFGLMCVFGIVFFLGVWYRDVFM